MTIRHVFVFCLLLGVATPTRAADAPLAWKFVAGDEHHYRLTQKMNTEITLPAGDRKVVTSVEQIIDMTWKVEAVGPNGDAQIVQQVDRLRMNMQAPGQPELDYDTDSDEPPTGFAAMLAPLYQTMLEEPLRMTMSPRGEFDKLDLPESFATAMKNVPGAAMMGELSSDEGFLDMLQKSSLVLPAPEDLSPGHQWTTKSAMQNPQLGSVTAESTYRYEGTREIEGTDYGVFNVQMKLDFGEDVGGTKLEITNQNCTGEILFDRQAGRLESSKLEQDIDMNVGENDQITRQKLRQQIDFQRIGKPTVE